jgi:hypothetical protein
MNRIARIAAVALSFAAAGTAFAESPDAAGPQVTLARAAAISVPTTVAATGVVTEADLQRSEVVASNRSRADVRTATLAAISNGELPYVSVDTNAFAVEPMKARTGQQLAAATR